MLPGRPLALLAPSRFRLAFLDARPDLVVLQWGEYGVLYGLRGFDAP